MSLSSISARSLLREQFYLQIMKYTWERVDSKGLYGRLSLNLMGPWVDLKMDTEIKSVAQPPRRQPFSVHEKMEMEWKWIEHSLEQDIIKKVHQPIG